MLDAMFYEVFKEEGGALRRYLPDGMRAGFTEKTIQDYSSLKLPAPVISLRTQSRIPKDWAGRLRGILTRSAGHDHIAGYLKATQTQIPCGYLPEYCARAVAEHAVLLALALLRKLKLQMKHLVEFRRDDITGRECRDRNVLIIGVGNIGMQVLDITQGLRMNALGVDIDPKTDNVAYTSLKKGVPWADIIICAVPLTGETRGMLNYQVLKKAKRGMILVNVARGEIAPVEGLARLLSEGILGGLGLDVYEKEDLLAECARRACPPKDKTVKMTLKLQKYNNVIFTPHNAFNTEESVERKASQSMQAVAEFLKTNRFPHPVPVL